MNRYPWSRSLASWTECAAAKLAERRWTGAPARIPRAYLFSTGVSRRPSASSSSVSAQSIKNKSTKGRRGRPLAVATVAADRKKQPSFLLPPPTVLFSNNHLLVVNKPPGWCSAPNGIVMNHADDGVGGGPPPGDDSNPNNNNKCLLTHLRHRRLGGGSQQQFLMPVHRIDQPCSGVQLYAKTSRAASKIQSNWRIGVRKTYVAVLHDASRALQRLMEVAGKVSSEEKQEPADGDEGATWYELHADLDRRQPRRLRRSLSLHRHHQGQRGASSSSSSPSPSSPSSNKGWSVRMIPRTGDDSDGTTRFQDSTRYRSCSLRFQSLCFERGFVRVATTDGSRHVVRALLACHGAPLAGDARYGATRGLPDRSVALHAERIEIVVVDPQLDRAGDPQHPRPSLLHDLRGPFVAPVPTTWNKWFGIPRGG